MRVIIAGSRSFEDYNRLEQEIDKLEWPIKQIVSGNARGADQLGEWYASTHEIELRVYPANWSKFGKAAGYIRNKYMAENADALIAFWDGKSKGTEHMINIAKDKGLITKVIMI